MNEGYIFVGNNVFPTIFALSSKEQEIGLMGQSWPPPIMTFVYDSPKINKFWMKNTPSPLDIIFCCDNKVSQICIGEPYSTSIIGADKHSDLVIELPYGTALSSNIRIGHNVGVIKPNIDELKKILVERR